MHLAMTVCRFFEENYPERLHQVVAITGNKLNIINPWMSEIRDQEGPYVLSINDFYVFSTLGRKLLFPFVEAHN